MPYGRFVKKEEKVPPTRFTWWSKRGRLFTEIFGICRRVFCRKITKLSPQCYRLYCV